MWRDYRKGIHMYTVTPAAKLEWTGKGPIGIVEGQTREDVRRLQALQDAALVV